MIEYQCPHCNRILKVPEKFIGVEGACSYCGTRLTIQSDVVASEPAEPPQSAANGVPVSGSSQSTAAAAQARLDFERLAKELEAERSARLEAEARIHALERKLAEATVEESENVLSRADIESMGAQLAQSRSDVARLAKELDAERALRMQAEAASSVAEKEDVRPADGAPGGFGESPVYVQPQARPSRPATRARRLVSILILVLIVALLLAVSLWRPSTESIRKTISPYIQTISEKLAGPANRGDASSVQHAEEPAPVQQEIRQQDPVAP